MGRMQEFAPVTKQQALLRQKNQCASCGEKISHLGQIGRKSHKYGEGAHAHHVRHVQQGGTNAVFNCVILCEACHYSVHEGGHYRNKAIRANSSDYPHYDG